MQPALIQPSGPNRDQVAALTSGRSAEGSGCVYDLVLFAIPERYAEANREFEGMVRHFQLLEAEKR